MARLPVDGRVPKGTVTGNCEGEDGKLESCGHITNDDKIDGSLNWLFSDTPFSVWDSNSLSTLLYPVSLLIGC